MVRAYASLQGFVQEFVQFFTARFRDYSFVRKALAIPVNRLNHTCRSSFNAFDNEILLGFEFSL